jgi:hypothetical protein
MASGSEDDFPGARGTGDSRAESSDDPVGEAPAQFPGRFHVPHRDGARVEVGEPIRVGGDRPWMVAVKLVGRGRDGPPEPTHTLLVRTGRGQSPDDARRAALAQLTLVYGSPVEPPPVPIISQKPSDPPAARSPPPPPQPTPWLTRLRRTVSRFLGRQRR